MAAPIVFYFEYASPYSYLASRLIDDFAAEQGRAVHWRPVRLRDIWEMIGRPQVPGDGAKAKMAYIRHDAARCARLQGVPFVLPERFPPDATLARLAFYRLDRDDPELARRFAHGVSSQYFGEGQDISTVAQLVGLSESLGVDRKALNRAANDRDAAAQLAIANESAAQSGCFGVPWFDIDREVFFGHDRLPYMAQWLGADSQGQ